MSLYEFFLCLCCFKLNIHYHVIRYFDILFRNIQQLSISTKIRDQKHTSWSKNMHKFDDASKIRVCFNRCLKKKSFQHLQWFRFFFESIIYVDKNRLNFYFQIDVKKFTIMFASNLTWCRWISKFLITKKSTWKKISQTFWLKK